MENDEPFDYGRSRVNIVSREDRDYWCAELECTVQDLVLADYKVGPFVTAIQQYLKERKAMQKDMNT